MPDIDTAVRHVLAQHAPRDAARIIADAFAYIAKRRLLAVIAEPDVVLSSDELGFLEDRFAGEWLSAKDVFAIVRQTDPDHATLIRLGRQLSARYRNQRKKGPTRQCLIELRTITDAKA